MQTQYILTDKERRAICDLARSLYYRNQVISKVLRKSPELITPEFISKYLVPGDLVDWALAIIDALWGDEYYQKGFKQVQATLKEIGIKEGN